MTKHAPATPLPITTSCDEEFRANAEEGRKYRAEQDRRANAYPQLVEALHAVQRDCHTRSELARNTMHSARALLPSLREGP